MTWSSGRFCITESKKSQGCSLKGTSPVLHQGEKSDTASSGTSAGHRGYGESPQGGYRRPGRAEQCDHSADAKPGDRDVLTWDPSMMDRGFEAWRRNTAGAHKTTIFGRYAGWTSLNAAGSSTVLRAAGRVPSAPRLQCLESLLPLCWGCRHFSQQGSRDARAGRKAPAAGPSLYHSTGEHSVLASTERSPMDGALEIKQNWRPASVFLRHWDLSSTEKYPPRPGILHP